MARQVISWTVENDAGEDEVLELPAAYDVCPRCEGSGSHVNPSVDGHGLSSEDFAEDPDFEESYFSGAYDVTCEECDGLRVVLVVDPTVTGDLLARYEAHLNDLAEAARERRSEERFGY